MANNQYNKKLQGANDPFMEPSYDDLGGLMNQGGKSRGAGQDQAMTMCLPELMNQGGSTEHPEAHPVGHHKKGPGLGKMMGQ